MPNMEDMQSMNDVQVTVVKHDGNMIHLTVDSKNTILKVRRNVHFEMDIPLNEWCLTTCGGKLLWDSRTLNLDGPRNEANLTKPAASKIKNGHFG